MKKKEQAVILIVDDREANLISLDALLGTDQRILVSARSGKEALEIVASQKVDLILLDVQMPDMNGFEVAQILKSGKHSSEIPILFASAERLDDASRMKGFEEGAIDYLFKPLNPELTKAKVSALLEVQRHKKQLIEKNTQLERSALLISNSADIIGVVDGNTLVIEEMNPAFGKLLGYKERETRGRSLTSFMDPADAAHVSSLPSRTSGNASFESKVICSDSTTKWIDWNVTVKNNKWFVNGRDITEIKALHAQLQTNLVQLQAANEELESFSYSVSHDLRAPLRAMNSNARILEEDFADQLDLQAKKHLVRIHENADRMDRLINDLLAFSRIGKKEVRKSTIDTTALVKEVFAEISQAHHNQAQVTIHTLPESCADLNLLRQVWTNLISNAIKYSAKKESPRIEIGFANHSPNGEYFIRDNGAGFDMAYAGKLFGTFQRLHDSTDFEGMGIGLAIVQRIIHKHGGTIRAEAAVEKGATFFFTLPG